MRNPFESLDIDQMSEAELDIVNASVTRVEAIHRRAFERIRRYYLGRSVRNKSKYLRKKYRKSRTNRGFYRAA